MNIFFSRLGAVAAVTSFTAAFLLTVAPAAQAADKELLDILLGNGAITDEQYDQLLQKPELKSEDLLGSKQEPPTAAESSGAATGDATADQQDAIDPAVAAEIDRAIDEKMPVKASYTSKGFRLESRDGNYQTNLQWRAQWRFNSLEGPDPRQVDDFNDAKVSDFEARRLRMKIGGHGYKPWLKYYFRG